MRNKVLDCLINAIGNRIETSIRDNKEDSREAIENAIEEARGLGNYVASSDDYSLLVSFIVTWTSYIERTYNVFISYKPPITKYFSEKQTPSYDPISFGNETFEFILAAYLKQPYKPAFQSHDVHSWFSFKSHATAFSQPVYKWPSQSGYQSSHGYSNMGCMIYYVNQSPYPVAPATWQAFQMCEVVHDIDDPDADIERSRYLKKESFSC